jgi:uncharacterized protein YjbJ (UPF0337 family)
MNFHDKNAQHHAKMAKDELRNDFQRAKEKICDACGTAFDNMSYAKHQATHMLKNSLGDLQDKAENVQENVTDYVKKNPVKSLVYALLAGAIASHLFRK